MNFFFFKYINNYRFMASHVGTQAKQTPDE